MMSVTRSGSHPWLPVDASGSTGRGYADGSADPEPGDDDPSRGELVVVGMFSKGFSIADPADPGCSTSSASTPDAAADRRLRPRHALKKSTSASEDRTRRRPAAPGGGAAARGVAKSGQTHRPQKPAGSRAWGFDSLPPAPTPTRRRHPRWPPGRGHRQRPCSFELDEQAAARGFPSETRVKRGAPHRSGAAKIQLLERLGNNDLVPMRTGQALSRTAAATAAAFDGAGRSRLLPRALTPLARRGGTRSLRPRPRSSAEEHRASTRSAEVRFLSGALRHRGRAVRHAAATRVRAVRVRPVSYDNQRGGER